MRDVDAGTPRPITPVPIPVMTCGDVEELSVMVIVPVRSPGCCGLKVTVVLQLAPTATVPTQFCEALKGSVLVPSPATEKICSGELEWLTIATVCVAGLL